MDSIGQAYGKEGSSRLDSLRDRSNKLLDKALRDIQQGRHNAPQAMEGRFRVAEFLLTEAKEFAESSWEELKAGRTRVSLAASRWILEAALNLLWGNMEANDLDNRLNFLAAEALRQEVALLNGLAELDKKKAKHLKLNEYATEVKKVQEASIYQTKTYPRSLDTRIKSLMPHLKEKSCPNPYPLYRICCGAAHPGFDLWLRFQPAPSGATVTLERPDRTALACFISATSIFWLVSEAYHLTQLGDSKHLLQWWTNEICPLLDAEFGRNYC